MNRRDAQDAKRRLWKELWVAAAVAAFGGTSLGSAVNGQEAYPPPPVPLEGETVKEALLELAAKSEELGIANKVMEVFIIATPEPGELYSFSGPTVKLSSPPFNVGDGSKVFDVPKDMGGVDGNLEVVPSTGNVIIVYDFSPAQTVICVGNQCKPIP